MYNGVSTDKLNVTSGLTPDNIPYVRVAGVYPFDAASTFECGQCFRFDRVSGASLYPDIMESDVVYGGVALGKYINVSSPDMNTVIIEGSDEADFNSMWRHYFQLD